MFQINTEFTYLYTHVLYIYIYIYMPKLSQKIDLRIIRHFDYPPYLSVPIRADNRGSTVFNVENSFFQKKN